MLKFVLFLVIIYNYCEVFDSMSCHILYPWRSHVRHFMKYFQSCNGLQYSSKLTLWPWNSRIYVLELVQGYAMSMAWKLFVWNFTKFLQSSNESCRQGFTQRIRKQKPPKTEKTDRGTYRQVDGLKDRQTIVQDVFYIAYQTHTMGWVIIQFFYVEFNTLIYFSQGNSFPMDAVPSPENILSNVSSNSWNFLSLWSYL